LQDNHGGRDCARLLERLHDAITSAGFFASIEEGRLISLFSAEGTPLVAAFVVECDESGVQVTGGVKGFADAVAGLPCEAREKLLAEILRIPVQVRAMIGLEEGVLTVDVPVDRDPYPTALAGFTLVARLTAWLAEQIARAQRGEPIEPFDTGIEDEGGEA